MRHYLRFRSKIFAPQPSGFASIACRLRRLSLDLFSLDASDRARTRAELDARYDASSRVSCGGRTRDRRACRNTVVARSPTSAADAAEVAGSVLASKRACLYRVRSPRRPRRCDQRFAPLLLLAPTHPPLWGSSRKSSRPVKRRFRAYMKLAHGAQRMRKMFCWATAGAGRALQPRVTFLYQLFTEVRTSLQCAF